MSSAPAPGDSVAGTRCARARFLLCRGGAKATAPPAIPTARKAPEGSGTDGEGRDGGLRAKVIPHGPRVLSTASAPSGDEAGGPQSGSSEGEPQKDRQVMREMREARLEKDFEEHGVSAEDKEARESAGIMVAMATTGWCPTRSIGPIHSTPGGALASRRFARRACLLVATLVAKPPLGSPRRSRDEAAGMVIDDCTNHAVHGRRGRPWFDGVFVERPGVGEPSVPRPSDLLAGSIPRGERQGSPDHKQPLAVLCTSRTARAP